MTRSNDSAEDLRDELLDYLYGCHEDPAAIEKRLESDAGLSAMLEEVRATKALLDGAARDEAPALDLRPPTPSAPPSPARILRLRGLAAAALLLLVVGPWTWTGMEHWRQRLIGNQHVQLVVSGPTGIPAGSPARVRVETWNYSGEANAARVSWRALDENGGVLQEGAADSSGTLDLDIRGDLPGVEAVEVLAERDGIVREARLALRPEQDAPLVHLSSDKAAYRPGEVMFLRAVALDRISLVATEGYIHARLVDPRGGTLNTWIESLQDGVLSLNFPVPTDARGGLYSFEIRDGEDAFAVESLPILVRRFEPPQLTKDLTLDRTTYAQGEEGYASLEVSRIAGGAAAGARVNAELLIDGERVWNRTEMLDENGRMTVRFEVPFGVDRGEARFVARITDGGVVETAIKPFVVPTGTVLVDLYPEGGALVGGSTARVYAECFDSLERPTSARGTVVDGNGRQVASFETRHQGRGRFTFVPEPGVDYELRLTEPVQASFALPEVKRRGVSFTASQDGFAPGEALDFDVFTTEQGPWILAAFCRGKLVAQDTFSGEGLQRLSLTCPDDVAGVLRVTLFDHRLQPVAERLVHRASGRKIQVSLRADHPTVIPGERQHIEVRTTDETGAPVSAVVGIGVSDLANREVADRYRVGLADQTWLLADVEELENVEEFLLDDPDAALHVDLLLGTRGWRRFAWIDPAALVEEHGDEGRRFLLREGHIDRPQVINVRGDTASLAFAATRRAKRSTGISTLTSLLFLVLVGGWQISRLPRPFPQIGLGLAGALVGWIAISYQMLRSGADFGPQAMLFTNEAAVAFDAAVAPPDSLVLDDTMVVEELDPFGPGVLTAIGGIGGAEGGPGAVPGRAIPRLLAGRPDGSVPSRDADALRAFFFDDGRWFEANQANEEVQARRQAQQTAQVRLYAHDRGERDPASPRVDFTETLFWNPSLVTSEEGVARVEFSTSDRVTTWAVSADAHGAGRVGQAESTFEAVPPFAMEARLPVEVAAGDELLIPVALTSRDPDVASAVIAADVRGAVRLGGAIPEQVSLTEGRGRAWLPLVVTDEDETATLMFAGEANGWVDRVGRSLRVVPRGFPVRRSRGGRLSGQDEFVVSVPGETVNGSLSLELKVYPSPLADLLEGIEGMLQEPYGCFEQASSVNYPNVLAAAYIDAAGLDAPAAVARARQLMDSGYARLVGYECNELGFEWFGNDPGHETLTAYGLQQFTDMASVFDVDPEMMTRTREWLLDRRDGEGGFELDPASLDSYGRAPASISNAYCTYALLFSGVGTDVIEPEIDTQERRADESEDSYELALAALCLELAGRDEAAARARARLAGLQEESGAMGGAVTSITRSGGKDLAVEVTSLAILAWLGDPIHEVSTRRAVEWLLEQRQGSGRFGATQATIQALRALVGYARENRRTANAGTLVVHVGETEAARVEFPAGHEGALEVLDLADLLVPGENRIRMELEGDNDFPWSADLSYFSEVPADSPDARVGIDTRLDRQLVEEGETVRVEVRLENLTAEGQPMTMGIVGLPAGLEVSAGILEDLRTSGTFDMWELDGRDVILYWRDLAPDQVVRFGLDCVATLPGTTTGPASRAYLYYTPELVRWAQPLSVDVDPAR